MTPSIWKRSAIRAGLITVAVMGYLYYTDALTPEKSALASTSTVTPLVGDMTPPSHFSNPYAQVPINHFFL